MSNKKIGLLEENLRKFLSLKEIYTEFVLLEFKAREEWDSLRKLGSILMDE